jgi:hypothetical protein
VEYRATGRFDLTKTQDLPYDDAPGAAISRAVVTKQFHGDLVGTSVTHLTQVISDTDGSAGYVAVERVVGTLQGRSGTFVLQHNALGDRGDRMLNIVVVPDTATGDLAGLRGKLHIDVSAGTHDYFLDYSFGGGRNNAP